MEGGFLLGAKFPKGWDVVGARLARKNIRCPVKSELQKDNKSFF